MKKHCIYIIGSLRNPKVPKIGNVLRGVGFEAFDDWWGAGEEADDKWRDYEKLRGRDMIDALNGRAAQMIYEFDRTNIERADAVLLVMPAGRSGHLEFGYARGKGKPGVILFDGEPERWDVMLNFASLVATDLTDAVRFFNHQFPSTSETLRRCRSHLTGGR